MRERNLAVKKYGHKFVVDEENVGVVFVSRKQAECDEYVQENKYRRAR